MICLNNSLAIGQGSNRACYLYPGDENKCIKITFGSNILESKKEEKYYKYLNNKKISWEQLAKYYGCENTDKGDGYIFEVIRDYNNEISKTLSYYLQNEERTRMIENPIVLLRELKEYLLTENIMIKDFNTKNIMYKKTSSNHGKLVIIDGLSRNRIFSMAYISKYFSSKVILKRYSCFYLSLFNKYKFNSYFIKLLKNSN